ncbi:mitochondrial sodium/calcium exchanger protein-like [Trichogramma pretiosum]|uniref:mitochondrial sodium/calcium exchanger protein-like n=1 Tax=Trichogramma pretiosum TaxID=7493 RepID=UPI0006C94F06|nr:mitochondrial sodium/calcium exchanger protein-like [Trichogramma pretiosum]
MSSENGNTLKKDDCSYVWNIADEERCEFVKTMDDCAVDSFLPYPTWLFCYFGTQNMLWFYLGLLALFCWLLYLFLILGTTSDNLYANSFCPSLSVIAAVLRLSENIAGVTILAFGNGAPDIFTSLVSNEGERLIMFTELIGAGVFVTAIIAGSVAVFAPFRLVPKYFLRDALFYTLTAAWICYIIADHWIYLWEAVGCILLYVLFIIVVVVMQSLESNESDGGQRMPTLRDADVLLAFVENRNVDVNVPPQLPKRSRAYDIHAKLDVAISREIIRGRTKSADDGANDEEEAPEKSSSASSRPRGLFREFLYDVNPINAIDWKESGWLVRILLVLRSPFMFVLQLLVPVVNETAEKRGWSKLLNCLQISFTLSVAIALLGYTKTRVGPVPLVAVTACCMLVLAVTVFVFTSVDRVPKGHNLLAFAGFLVAMLVVYLMAKEVMSVLQCIGFASGISDAMLGITLLAWGNSVGDLISNVTIARRGFPRMGFSACFGGPMFNTLMGLGLTYGLAVAKEPELKIKIRTSHMAMGCLAFLLSSLTASLIYLTITGFAARRSYGFLLYTVYAVFMTINLLSEGHVIHPLGVDHRP